MCNSYLFGTLMLKKKKKNHSIWRVTYILLTVKVFWFWTSTGCGPVALRSLSQFCCTLSKSSYCGFGWLIYVCEWCTICHNQRCSIYFPEWACLKIDNNSVCEHDHQNYHEVLCVPIQVFVLADTAFNFKFNTLGMYHFDG